MSRAGRRGLLEAALLLTLGFVVGLTTIGRPLASFDEGFILVGAERVLHGELPYRDFYALYPPGQYYLVAGLFAIFGSKVMVLRLYCVLVRALLAWLVYRVTRRIAGRGAAMAAWGGAVLWAGTFGNFGLSTYPALALALLALELLLAEIGRASAGSAPRPARLALAGAALAGAALVRHDLAAYGLVASLPLLSALARRAALRAVAVPFGGALAAVFLVAAAPFLILAPWSEIAFELFLYPARSYAEMRSLPYPPLFVRPPEPGAIDGLVGLAIATPGLPFLVPPLLAALAFGALLSRRFDRGAPAEPVPAGAGRDAGLLAVALLTLLCANLARVRPDPLHAAPSVVVSFALAAALAERLARHGFAGRGFAAGVLILSAGSAVPAAAALTALASGPVRPQLAPHSRGEIDPARAAHLPAEPLQRELAAWIAREVPEGGRIFVGCGRHDRLFINEPILYFLSGRLPGAKYHSLDPGVATTRAAQEEIVRGLERQRVEIVVLSTRFDERNEPNGSSVSSGVTLLDDYLASHYAPVARADPWYTLLRRTVPWERGFSAP